jgi:hypothetical protein
MVVNSARRNFAIEAKGEGQVRPALLFLMAFLNELADGAIAGQTDMPEALLSSE